MAGRCGAARAAAAGGAAGAAGGGAQPNMSQPKRPAERWKQTRPSLKHESACLYSAIIPSTAGCMLPSGPRSARPGPTIASSVVLRTAMISKHIAITVTLR